MVRVAVALDACEPSGVTVYVYDESVGYKKEAFLKGSTLAKAMKKYR